MWFLEFQKIFHNSNQHMFSSFFPWNDNFAFHFVMTFVRSLTNLISIFLLGNKILLQRNDKNTNFEEIVLKKTSKSYCNWHWQICVSFFLSKIKSYCRKMQKTRFFTKFCDFFLVFSNRISTDHSGNTLYLKLNGENSLVSFGQII